MQVLVQRSWMDYKQMVLMDIKDNKVTFRLLKVTTEQFAIIENSFQKESEIKLETNLKFAANKESRQIGVFAQFQFSCNHNPFIILEVGCHFEIKKESWEQMIEKTAIILPKAIMQHLCALTVGTARGVLHAKTENTSLNQIVLPTINIAEIIEADVKFELVTL